VVQGPTEKPEDATYAGVEDAMMVIAEQFEHQPKDV
jgi:hypothetical protein